MHLCAAKAGHWDICRFLLEHHAAHIDARDGLGNSLLAWFVQHDNPEVFSLYAMAHSDMAMTWRFLQAVAWLDERGSDNVEDSYYIVAYPSPPCFLVS